MAAEKKTRPNPSPRRKKILEKRRAEERAAAPPPKERELSGNQTRYLRGLGHHLEPVVHIGKEGHSPALVKAINEALAAHELIKVRLLQEAPVDRKVAGPELAKLTASSLVQTIGRTLLLFKRHPNKPKIVLPKPTAAPRVKLAAPKAPVEAEAEAEAANDEDDETDEN